jgi:hypothetical protein
MKIEQTVLHDIDGDMEALHGLAAIEPQLVLVFGCVQHFASPQFAAALAKRFPHAQRVGCTTAGEISSEGVSNHSTVVTAIHFAHPDFSVVTANLPDMEHSFSAGLELANKLELNHLKAVLVLGQGVNINGSAMIDGMACRLGKNLPVTGGLAGDDGAFSKTYVLCNDGVFTDRLLAIGFRGENFVFTHGSYGGWQPFGPVRKVTCCVGNVLFELDGEPALDVYKRYLGDHAKDLPGSGLLFPFEMLSGLRESTGQIRTILGVDENAGSLILAGAINSDGYLRLMHAHTNDLVEGAEEAAKATMEKVPPIQGQALGLLVSCVGRKLVMGGRVDEEVEAVQEVMGEDTVLTGFYSNGEICPGYKLEACSLHNQTMTITYLSEKT